MPSRECRAVTRTAGRSRECSIRSHRRRAARRTDGHCGGAHRRRARGRARRRRRARPDRRTTTEPPSTSGSTLAIAHLVEHAGHDRHAHPALSRRGARRRRRARDGRAGCTRPAIADKPVLAGDAIAATTVRTDAGRTTARAPVRATSIRAMSTSARSCSTSRRRARAIVHMEHLGRRPTDGRRSIAPVPTQPGGGAGRRPVDEAGKTLFVPVEIGDERRLGRADGHVAARAVAAEHDDRHAAELGQLRRPAPGVERRAGTGAVDERGARRGRRRPARRCRPVSRAAHTCCAPASSGGDRPRGARCRSWRCRAYAQRARAAGGRPCPPTG